MNHNHGHNKEYDEQSLKKSMWSFRSNYMQYYYNKIDSTEIEKESVETMRKRQEMELHLMKLWHQRQHENINRKGKCNPVKKTEYNSNFLRNRCKNLSKKNQKRSSSQDEISHIPVHNNNMEFDPLDIK